jgi:hypothetical protein
LAGTGFKSNFGYFLPFFTFLWWIFWGSWALFWPKLFWRKLWGSRGYQNGQNWGVHGVITLKCGCYPLQRPPATLHGVWCHNFGPLCHKDYGAQIQCNLGLQQAYGQIRYMDIIYLIFDTESVDLWSVNGH